MSLPLFEQKDLFPNTLRDLQADHWSQNHKIAKYLLQPNPDNFTLLKSWMHNQQSRIPMQQDKDRSNQF